MSQPTFPPSWPSAVSPVGAFCLQRLGASTKSLADSSSKAYGLRTPSEAAEVRPGKPARNTSNKIHPGPQQTAEEAALAARLAADGEAHVHTHSADFVVSARLPCSLEKTQVADAQLSCQNKPVPGASPSPRPAQPVLGPPCPLTFPWH